MSLPRFVFAVASLTLAVSARSADFPKLNSSDWAQLEKGHPILLSNNPGCPDADGKCYVNGAVLIKKSVGEVWEVVKDAEAAPTYVDDLELAKIISVQGDSFLVEQGMKVPGFRSLVRYIVRIFPTPEQKLVFRAESGRLRAMDGGWWLHPVQDGTQTLLVYSLFVDPGRMAPQMMVRSSLKKKIPVTLVALRGEVMRRATLAAR